LLAVAQNPLQHISLDRQRQPLAGGSALAPFEPADSRPDREQSTPKLQIVPPIAVAHPRDSLKIFDMLA
jgi:hypothetical protein